jgi:hypothetical protein
MLWCQQKRAMFIPSFDAKHLQWRCCSVVVLYSFSFAQALSSCVSFAAIHMPAYLPRNIMTFNDDWWGGRREVEEWQTESSVDEGRRRTRPGLDLMQHGMEMHIHWHLGRLRVFRTQTANAVSIIPDALRSLLAYDCS